ncbi:MAG: VIT1/CCC1 transporter family protein [Fimbriimonadaceae bacterium]|nr:VIT1/CCC1 transporter family protein [Alphaproteobacteria bacterium]
MTDLAKHDHSHHPDAIADRLAIGPRVNYLRDWVYGGIDGAITTFAIVAGVVGANMSTRVVLILGAANLLADGFSMAAANYSGTKTEIDDYHRLRRIEERHIDLFPEGEKEEMRQIYRTKGFEGEDLENMIEIATSSKDHWIDFMMVEEYGLALIQRSPIMSGIITFLAFAICGFVPLIPFILGLPASPIMATVMTGIVFFIIGSLKSKWSTQKWYASGGETLFIGLIAAGMAFAIGDLLGGIM